MAKYKTGLYKKISAIFGGVSTSRNDNTGQLPAASKEESPDCVSPELSVIEELFSSSLPPQQTIQPSPKAVSSKQPVITDTVMKTSWRISWRQYWKQIKNKLFIPKDGVNASRHKATVILMPVLLVIFVFIIVRVSSQPSPKAAHAQDLGKANVGSSVAIPEKKINWQIPEPYPATLRDPMPAGSSAAGQGGDVNLIVKGIVYSEDRPSAVVGNQIVHQGDKVSGATVVKINKNNVEFEMNDKKWTQDVQR
jgi:hypothetical protein